MNCQTNFIFNGRLLGAIYNAKLVYKAELVQRKLTLLAEAPGSA